MCHLYVSSNVLLTLAYFGSPSDLVFHCSITTALSIQNSWSARQPPWNERPPVLRDRLELGNRGGLSRQVQLYFASATKVLVVVTTNIQIYNNHSILEAELQIFVVILRSMWICSNTMYRHMAGRDMGYLSKLFLGNNYSMHCSKILYFVLSNDTRLYPGENSNI